MNESDSLNHLGDHEQGKVLADLTEECRPGVLYEGAGTVKEL